MIGQNLGHYRIVERIGAGGMGEVYRANDQHLERDVALKILPTGFVADQAARKRFRREALALSKLNHPNIATIFDFDTQDGVDFLAMELINGTLLSSQVKVGPLPEKEILRLGIQLTEGLVAAHAQGVIHRDLKPGNLIITREGRLKILDFGLAVLVIPENIPDSTRTLTQATPVEGTLPYMSPEQLRGQQVDARSDVYSAGAVLYEMATGNRPFPHSQSAELIGAILHETPPPPRSINQRVTPGLEILILKTLEKEREHRYQSAAELQVALEDRKTDRILNIRVGQRRTQPIPRPSVHDQDLRWIRERLSSEPKLFTTHREPFESVPPLPPNYIEPSAWRHLRGLLVTHADASAPVAIEGQGGVGKTVMAIALCHDNHVRERFADGIVWLTVGKESSLKTVDRVKQVAEALNEQSRGYTEANCEGRYRALVVSKKVLIVLDNVWHSGDVTPFRLDTSDSRLLYTTRELPIAGEQGARKFPVPLLDEGQSRSVIAEWSGLGKDELPEASIEILRQCGGLPLALGMIGAILRGASREKWERVLKKLRESRLEKIKANLPGYEYASLDAAIEVSLHDLDEETRERYLKLAILSHDMLVAPTVLRTLWNTNEDNANETTDEFENRSLATREKGGIRLHNTQSGYVDRQYPEREALAIIQGAVRLSSHVIEKDPQQFASQVLGRLLPRRDIPAIQQFIDEIAAGAPTPWLRPLKNALTPPGTPLLRTLEGHSASIYGVALTPDGRRAVSASGDNTLKVWDLYTGRLLRTLEGHTYWVFGVAVTPEGQRAVSASCDHTLKVWDLETGCVLRTLEGHSDSVNSVAVTSDGRRVVSASRDKTLKVWDLETGRALRTLEGHSGGVAGVAVAPDGKRAISASWDNTLKLWDSDTGCMLHTLEGHSAFVNGVAVTPDGKRAISASWDNTLKVWDLETGRALRTLEGHDASCLAVTPDGKRVVSASWDNTLKVWDLDNGRALRTLEGHDASCLAVTPDGKRAVSASRDKTLKVWDLNSEPGLRRLEGHSNYVTCVVATPDGNRAVSASRDDTLKVWDLETGCVLRTLEGHSNSVRGVAVTPDGNRAVSASWDKTLKVWDLDTGCELRTLEGHSKLVHGVAVTPNGNRAVSASMDKTLKLWDLDTGRALRTLEGHSDSVTGVAATSDGRRAVSASEDKTLMIWDLDTGRALRTLEGHSGGVRGVAVTLDGKRAISASWDSTLKLWDLDTGRMLHTLEGHSSLVAGVALTLDGKRAVSASFDKTLMVWDLDTGLLVATFYCDAPARCCAFVDQQRIVAGDSLGRVHVLSLVETESHGAPTKAKA